MRAWEDGPQVCRVGSREHLWPRRAWIWTERLGATGARRRNPSPLARIEGHGAALPTKCAHSWPTSVKTGLKPFVVASTLAESVRHLAVVVGPDLDHFGTGPIKFSPSLAYIHPRSVKAALISRMVPRSSALLGQDSARHQRRLVGIGMVCLMSPASRLHQHHHLCRRDSQPSSVSPVIVFLGGLRYVR